ncbi:uncharacterized protein LACBIDRAFT_311611 [Laccaria bicolor S238N-H82]|uniref:Predicted protein n=1 Tax=Laccaria bicolor (strain S238N-H82 / ATCC MYA-4686) TaxID=486041 RepID=B0CXU0_LACBS|nr:uncharacterized protein LACBIDRAFT_311611 [Laccaria bicolor S238N-H82]EDR12319.1 predicted protein [Laccaria bicolor S238N-H82]|eukprot:XP_001876583.1 predicted protein [Laccaria bicolor S238N-H82]
MHLPLGHDKAQSIIDQITSAYETGGGPPPGRFGFGPQHLGGSPSGYGGPPMGFDGLMPPPGFGGHMSDCLSYPNLPLTISFLPSATSLPPWARIFSDDASRRSSFPSKWHGTARGVPERSPSLFSRRWTSSWHSSIPARWAGWPPSTWF